MSSSTAYFRATGIWRSLLAGILLAVCAIGCSEKEEKGYKQLFLERQREMDPRHAESGNLRIWWDSIPKKVTKVSFSNPDTSNIRPADYVGPEACRECHKKNYQSWSKHPHRWMNARAEAATVHGQFSGEQNISYLGGRASFLRSANGDYQMRLARDNVRREYEVTQTIGSRFFQYYVGRQVSGPESRDHKYFTEEHVLPFGYWLDHEEWVPVVHIGSELPDGERPDPFAVGKDAREQFARYASRCNSCHTTFPLGDMMIRDPFLIGRHAPSVLNLLTSAYVAENHSELWDGSKPTVEFSDQSLGELSNTMRQFKAADHDVTLGVTCESCHLGAAEHARTPTKKPLFFPSSRHLHVESDTGDVDYGRTHANLNWACGRCHAGDRPYFAAGMSTWNSTEYSDAMKGSCYSQLTCVECHNPHEAIGKGWTKTASQDDSSCLKCHSKFEAADARVAHTHHPIDSAGARCMNCHMPRLNEGLQDIVRTHTIFSPTNRKMIEANQPNACNMCHTEKPINWTLAKLKEWYGADYPKSAVARNYPDPEGPTAIGWLQSEVRAVRLVAADALARSESRWALPELLQALDDDHLLNRQFAQIGVEKLLNIRLLDFGYRFYMIPEERLDPIQKLRDMFVDEQHSNEGPEPNGVSEDVSQDAPAAP
jgi:predicted CXXCH cytochrome family protein